MAGDEKSGKSKAFSEFLKNSFAPIALALLTFFGVTISNRIAALDLLSKREESETSLRAQMFASLLDPLVGVKGGGPLGVDREALMVSLLALNFHEDFELGPLLRHVDERLAHPKREKIADSTAQDLRGELRSIARRITERQVAGILGTTLAKPGDSASVVQLQLEQRGSDYCLSQVGKPDTVQILLPSPDRTHWLFLTACNPDWVNQTIRVGYNVQSNAKEVADAGDGDANSVSGAFVLTWYDFPLTDNLRLPDGNRFAVTMRAVHDDSTMTLKVVWFPKTYFTPRERPMDYSAMAKEIGIHVGK
jgi:hypothetical protein